MRSFSFGLVVSLASLALLAPASALAQALGQDLGPGEKRQLSFLSEPSFIKDSLDMAVQVARGAQPGPTLCVTAAVHGDEINGVEIARRVYAETDAATLSGTLVVMPIVNVWGFRSGSRYTADGRDLNRSFPGSTRGSTASRIAYQVFERVIRGCDALLDLHTGSGERTNLPQVRVELGHPAAFELATRFGVGVVLGGGGPEGALRRAALDAGVPAVLYEGGGPNRFESEEIARGLEGVRNVMEFLDMLGEEPPPVDPQRVFRSSRWVRAVGGGIFLSELQPGQRVEAGALLGHVTDPMTSQRFEITAPVSGTLIGKAWPQVVFPGFGLFHIASNEAGAHPASDEPLENLD